MFADELEKQGNWLFRRRSYLPLVLLPIGVIALAEHDHYLGDSVNIELAYGFGCFLISLGGLVIRAIALGYAQPGSSGRNTKGQVADNLNMTGIYSIVRNPLYLGNVIMLFGVLLFTKSVTFTAAGTLFYLLFYERIIAAEERFLTEKFGDVYSRWNARTPALWPRFSQWEPPGCPFSWRAAIKGEFYGFTALVTVIMVMDMLKNWFTEGRLEADIVWIGLFVISLIVFVILRYIRKHTGFFEGETKTIEN